MLKYLRSIIKLKFPQICESHHKWKNNVRKQSFYENTRMPNENYKQSVQNSLK